MNYQKTRQAGFTLVELLVVIGVIAILAAVVLVAINPGRQFAQARDTQRRSDLYSITNAIYQYSAEHEGTMPATAVPNNFPAGDTPVCIGTGGGCFNLATAGNVVGAASTDTIVPTYISEIPKDPSRGSDENTFYLITQDDNGRVVASASGELVSEIKVTR